MASTFINCNIPHRSTLIYASILLRSSGEKVRDRKYGEFGPVCVSEVGTNVRGPMARFRILERATAATIISNRSNVNRIVKIHTVRVTVSGTGGCNVKVITIQGDYRCNVTNCCMAVTARTKVIKVANAGTHPSVTPARNIRGVLKAGPFAVNVPASRRFPFIFSTTASVVRENEVRCCTEVNGSYPINAIINESNSTLAGDRRVLARLGARRTTLTPLNKVNRRLNNCGNCSFTATIRLLSTTLRRKDFLSTLSKVNRGKRGGRCRLNR